MGKVIGTLGHLLGRFAASLAVGLALLVMLPTGLGPPASAAPDAAYRDYRVDETRTIPAYLPSTDEDRIIRVFSVRFWARQGERRYVTSQVVARQPSSTPGSAAPAAP